jgi:hypothetical protein
MPQHALGFFCHPCLVLNSSQELKLILVHTFA